MALRQAGPPIFGRTGDGDWGGQKIRAISPWAKNVGAPKSQGRGRVSAPLPNRLGMSECLNGPGGIP